MTHSWSTNRSSQHPLRSCGSQSPRGHRRHQRAWRCRRWSRPCCRWWYPVQ